MDYEQAYRDEYDIVDKVWKAINGGSLPESIQAKPIWQIVADMKVELDDLRTRTNCRHCQRPKLKMNGYCGRCLRLAKAGYITL